MTRSLSLLPGRFHSLPCSRKLNSPSMANLPSGKTMCGKCRDGTKKQNPTRTLAFDLPPHLSKRKSELKTGSFLRECLSVLFYASSAAALFLGSDKGSLVLFTRPKELGVFLLVRFLCTSKENELACGCENPRFRFQIQTNGNLHPTAAVN